METEVFLEIKKSKFYGYAFEISSKEEIKTILEQIKKEHKKARHICYGYVINKNGRFQSGYNDDGEPSGTAGKPIRDVLIKSRSENLLIFVVRYFGGILLGAGGLARAYTKCAALAKEKFYDSNNRENGSRKN
ncbi:YigZ family protein [Mycoplasmopsis gallinarum]